MNTLRALACLTPDVLVPRTISDSAPGWIVWFVLTQIVECLVVLLVWRSIGRPGAQSRFVSATLLGNLVSHPLATAALVSLEPAGLFSQPGEAGNVAGGMLVFLAVECGVVLLESVAYRRIADCPWDRARTVSILVNAPTAIIGFVVGFLL
ncbi:MAG TPA: hypothetical protein VM509_14400 [Planctomycetota bacterium]|nr:hypothetical protein [Planctomycetota bacterium]